jgi:nicotinamide-nucleotide amidase
VNVELINTGSELMLGRIVNSHQAWLCRRLADAGFLVNRQVAIPDNASAIRGALCDALKHAELVLMTGGLGPTSDDLTRDVVAELLGRRLIEDPDARANIEGYFSARQRPMPVRVLVQAMVPEGAIVLPNRNGTAPGLAIEIPERRFGPHASWLFLLPGPPRELHPMFAERVLPLLNEHFTASESFHCTTLRTCGLGESWVEDRLAPLFPPLVDRGLDVGYCARVGEVDIRLAARGPAGPDLLAKAADIVRSRLGEYIYGTDDDSLESVVIRLATERRARLAVAESCTGGLLANRLTDVPGASAVFWGGWVVYDNESKSSELGVNPGVFEEHGAVSEPCALAMAEGALARSGATHALAITGIAGPAGGTPQRPVGTVFIALAAPGIATVAREFRNPFDRSAFKYVTTQQALELLRRRLIAADPG